MTDDLVPRLYAAIDKVEEVAKQAGGVPWVTMTRMVHVDPKAIRDNKLAYGRLGYVAGVEHTWDLAHIAANDPATVLRMCQAHRKIVDALGEFRKRRDEIEQGDYPAPMVAAARAETAALGWVIEHIAEGYGLTTEDQPLLNPKEGL